MNVPFLTKFDHQMKVDYSTVFEVYTNQQILNMTGKTLCMEKSVDVVGLNHKIIYEIKSHGVLELDSSIEEIQQKDFPFKVYGKTKCFGLMGNVQKAFDAKMIITSKKVAEYIINQINGKFNSLNGPKIYAKNKINEFVKDGAHIKIYSLIAYN